MRSLLFKIVLVTLVTGQVHVISAVAENTVLQQKDLFISGEEGYHTFRIPSVIQTKSGALLAFCEGRKSGRSDTGDIDLVMKRSEDAGQTWSNLQVIWDDEANVCGNPCPVVDQSTGTVWLLLTWNSGQVPESKIQPGYGEKSRRVFVSHSDDEGETWTEPQNITSSTKAESWSWYATGPGIGIQMERGKHPGRLVIPCDHKEPTASGMNYGSHVIYSDDQGKTWQRGERTPEQTVNECQVVELLSGSLMLNMRNGVRTKNYRQVATSLDAGESWRQQHFDEALIEPICQASLVRYRWALKGRDGILLFSNPASKTSRDTMTVRASYDDGKTWSVSRVLYPDSSAYSCLCALQGGEIGCLYERDNYGKITWATFPLDWLTQEAE